MVNNSNGGGTNKESTSSQNMTQQDSTQKRRTLKEKSQSVSERRELRKEYRTLIQDVQASKNELVSPSSDGLLQTIKKSDQLYKNVHQAREAVLDSELLSLTSQLGLEQAQKFKVTLNSFDSIGFLTRIKEKLVKLSKDAAERNRQGDQDEDDNINNGEITSDGWDLLSKEYSSHFNTLPAFEFMYGPIDLEPPAEKKRAERKKAQKDDQPIGKATTAEAVTDTSTQVESETTSMRVQCMKRYLEKDGNEGMPIVDLIAADSFAHTVENMFYFSFLLKDGHVKIAKDDNLTVISTQPPEEKDYQNKSAHPTHAVVRLDYKTYLDFSKYSSKEFDMNKELELQRKSSQPTQESQRSNKKAKH